MMATFVGSQGSDLQDLMVPQVIVAPVAFVFVAWRFSILVRQCGYRNVFTKFLGLPSRLASVRDTCCELIGADRQTFVSADPAPHFDLTALAGIRAGSHRIFRLSCGNYLLCDLSLSGKGAKASGGRD
jgi:hypothetical protein